MLSSVSSSSSKEEVVQQLLDAARPFLRGELEKADPRLPSLVAVLRSAGAGECSHKHGCFLDHLLGVHRILKLWGAPDPVALCGLFHSAYSNSYVNLAIFDPSTTGRDAVRGLVGPDAERLAYLFCDVPRHSLVHARLLFRYPDDEELLRHLRDSEASLAKLIPKQPSSTVVVEEEEEEWRTKLRSVVPDEGMIVGNIKTGEEMRLSRRLVAVFLLLAMADFSDQYYGWQDALFENLDGRLEFSGDGSATALWPGDGKPGLWMNSISRMGALYNLIVREEKLLMICSKSSLESENINGAAAANYGDEEEEEYDGNIIDLVVPPVFNNCTEVFDAGEQIEARDLYWEVISSGGGGGGEALLLRSIGKNPYVGEPHVVLAQVYLSLGRFEEAEKEAEEGLRLLLEWATPWDKRTSWQAWVAWTRVLLMKAKEKSWPGTAWGIINLGLVR